MIERCTSPHCPLLAASGHHKYREDFLIFLHKRLFILRFSLSPLCCCRVGLFSLASCALALAH